MVLFKEFVWRSQDRIMCLCRCVCEREIKIPTRVTPERTSSREIRLCPSLRSSYRSVMCFLTWERKGRRGNEGTVKRWRRGGWGAEKGERGEKLIPHSNHPSVDSTLLTSVRLIARLPDRRAGDSGCRGDRDEAPAVTLSSLLAWHRHHNECSGGWVVTGGDRRWHGESAAWPASVLVFVGKWDTQWDGRMDGRRLFEAEHRRNNGSAKLWWIKQYIYCVLLRNAVVYFGTIVSVLHLLYKIDDLSFKLHLQFHFVYETTTEFIMECQHKPSVLEL